MRILSISGVLLLMNTLFTQFCIVLVMDPECGRGWVASPDYTNSFHAPYCYQLNKEDRDWHDAAADCRNKGGQLASVSSPHEQLYISGKYHSTTKLQHKLHWCNEAGMTSIC